MPLPRSAFLKTLTERGFIHQCTDLAALDDAMSAGPVAAYIGFDATADSLHTGHLLPIMALRWLQRSGTKLIALTPDRSATTLRAFIASIAPDQPLALMVGAEEPGLSATALEAADARIRIPISPDVDSLNVAVAAGIALATLQPA